MIREMLNEKMLVSDTEKPVLIVDGHEIMKIDMIDAPDQVTMSFYFKSNKALSSDKVNFDKIIENTELKKILLEKKWIIDDRNWSCVIPITRQEFGEWEEKGKLYKISFRYLQK